MRDIVGWHLDEHGELTSSPADDLVNVPLEERQPPTDPVAYHDRQGVITAWPSSSRSRVMCGSLRRLRVAVELDFASDIGQFSGEPVELHWRQGSVRHRWRPDFIARTREGSRCAVIVPPARRSGPQWQERIAALHEVAQAAGWTARLWPVPHGTRLANLMWLSDYRFPAQHEQAREKAVLAAFRRPRPLDEGTAACGVPQLVALDLAYRLMWQQRLRFDWTRPLLGDAPIWT